MTPLLDITILGEPVGQGRPRAVRRGPSVRLHSAPRSAVWQALAATQMHYLWNEQASAPHTGPVMVDVLAIGPRPKSLRKRYGLGRQWRTTKPDLDNIVKAVLDALVQGGVLRDDTQACALSAHHYIAAHDEGPCVRVRVHHLEPLAVEVTP